MLTENLLIVYISQFPKFPSDYRGIATIVSQNRNDFMVLGRDRVLRWAIDRLTEIPYHRWVSRIVDRLLMAIEGGAENV